MSEIVTVSDINKLVSANIFERRDFNSVERKTSAQLTSQMLTNIIGIPNPRLFLFRFMNTDDWKIGDSLVAFLIPLEQTIDFQIRNPEEYARGLEWPILLICDQITTENAIQLERIVSKVGNLLNLEFLGSNPRLHAVAFLLSMVIFRYEFNAYIGELPSILRLGHTGNSPLDDSKMQAISTMSLEDKLVLELKRRSPVFTMDKISGRWEKELSEDAKQFAIGNNGPSQLLDFRMFPPFPRTLSDIQTSEEPNSPQSTLHAPVQFYQMGEQAIHAGIQPGSPEIEIFLRLVQGDESLNRTENIFRRYGKIWFIQYDGKISLHQDLDGLKYIAVLLENRGKMINTIDLMAMDADFPKTEHAHYLSMLSGERLEEIGLIRSDLGDQYPLLDKRGFDQLEERIEQLAVQVESGYFTNPNGRAEASEEFGALKQFKKCLQGYRNHVRSFSTGKDSTRVNVKRRIDHALTQIDKDNPALFNHLKRHIRTGRFCCYSEDAAIRWHIQR